MSSEPAMSPRTVAPSLAPATLYWRVSGIMLSALAALGFILNAIGQSAAFGTGFLVVDPAHDAVHVLLAVTALAIGFGPISIEASRNAAKTAGIAYLVFGLAGFFVPVVTTLSGLLGLHLELGENLVHLALGGWGVYAGFDAE